MWSSGDMRDPAPMDDGMDGVRCRDIIDDALDGGDTSGWICDQVSSVVIGRCKYWVRLKCFYVVARFSANFSENCSQAVSGRLWGSRGKFKNHSSL